MEIDGPNGLLQKSNDYETGKSDPTPKWPIYASTRKGPIYVAQNRNIFVLALWEENRKMNLLVSMIANHKLSVR
jgi:hypothetical protein